MRRSQRSHVPPAALRDYICNQVSSPQSLSSSPSFPSKGTQYPLFDFISYDRYSPQQRSFVATITNDVEPTCYDQASSQSHWQTAMQSELAALEAPTIHGHLHLFLLESKLPVAVGCTKSSANQMVLLNAIKCV